MHALGVPTTLPLHRQLLFLMPGSATTASSCPRTGVLEQMEPLVFLSALPPTSLLGAVGQHLLVSAAAHEALHYIIDICGNNN